MIKTKFRGGEGGGFNYPDTYKYIVNQLPDPAVIVEVGVWDGESTVFMAEFIKASGKNIKFYTVDPFAPFKIDGVWHQANINVYFENIRGYQVETIIKSSVEAAKNFQDESLDFVFIDANHEYESIKEDIKAWLPKVKKGGILGGHDYADGVKKAVDEMNFKDLFLYENTSWLTHV
jgi:predicted O-methyltransferase YrrM